MMKRIRVIAGPNGSGKTTLFRQLAKRVKLYDFINADEMKLLLEDRGYFSLPFDLEPEELTNSIAASSFDEMVKVPYFDGSIRCCEREVIFSPDAVNSYSVAAFADFLRNAYMRRGISFTMETVFSHPAKLQFLSQACDLGYRIYLYFVVTDSPELNVMRVKQRVDVGGHDVPREKIIERYFRCLDNFYDSLQYAYRAFFWDNSTCEMKFFAELKPDHCMDIVGETPTWFENYILKKIQ